MADCITQTLGQGRMRWLTPRCRLDLGKYIVAVHSTELVVFPWRRVEHSRKLVSTHICHLVQAVWKVVEGLGSAEGRNWFEGDNIKPGKQGQSHSWAKYSLCPNSGVLEASPLHTPLFPAWLVSLPAYSSPAPVLRCLRHIFSFVLGSNQAFLSAAQRAGLFQ